MPVSSPSIRGDCEPRVPTLAQLRMPTWIAGLHKQPGLSWLWEFCFASRSYLMNYPLWWDEAFVAVNFIRRDYVDLLRPLDYGQVCPILFLWCELTVVRILGFSEWSLRLFPVVCAIVSVFLFRHVTGRVVRGLPLFGGRDLAVSFHPIIHAADVKPYASDLMAALILLAIAVEWCGHQNVLVGCGPWQP